MRKKLKGLAPAKTKKKYFVPGKVYAWHSLTLMTGQQISDEEATGSIGFIPVYPTRELADKACPEDTIIEMQEKDL